MFLALQVRALILTSLATPSAMALDDISHLEEAKDRIHQSALEKRRALGQLYKVSVGLKEMAHRQSRLNEQLFSLQGDIEDLTETIQALELKSEHLTKALKRQMRSMYMMKGQSLPSVVFSSRSPLDFERQLKYLKTITTREADLLAQYSQSQKALVKKSAQLQKEWERLGRIKKALALNESRLLKDQEKKSIILAEIKRKYEKDEKVWKRLQRSSAGTIMDVNGSTFFAKRGQLPMPIEGQRRVNFGVEPGWGIGLRLPHKGWFISAQEGEPARAVHDGEVVFAGSVPGHSGKTVILDHGDHYFTVYGQLKELDVTQNQRLSAGDLVGKVGAPQIGKGVGLYFELRHFSDAVDPAKWIKKMDNWRTSQNDQGEL